MTEILTWHNDPKLKAKVLAGYDAHIKADTLIKGEYFNYDDGFTGCHVGCVVHDLGGKEIDSYTELTGLPVWLRDLSEYFFENMEYPQNQKITRDILDAVPHGKDLTPVYHKFLIWLLEDAEHGTIQYCDESGVKATRTAVALHKKAVSGKEVTSREWPDAGDAAWNAAGDAARAARAAAGDAAGDAAWDAAWDAQVKALTRLLKEA